MAESAPTCIIKCTIEWNTLGLAEWDHLFRQIRRTTLLQSYPYAQAAGARYHQRARWGLIRIEGQPAGLVQVLETAFPGHILQGVILDRGPLWLPGYGSAQHWLDFCIAFDQAFPRRIGRRRRMIPELGADQAMVIPWQEVPRIKPYQTIWLDLSPDEETLRKGLDKKWRNALSKAERSGLRLEWSESEDALSWLLLHHEVHRADQKYRAASPRLIRLLARYCRPRGEMLIGRAFAGDEPVAGVLFFRHGLAATYQVGWSGDAGREVNAHQLLLWRGMVCLKDEGILDLDLGGINDSAEGVRTFKEGMGGQTATLSGIYT